MALARMIVNLAWSDASGSPGVNTWHLRSGEDFDLDFDQLTALVGNFYSSITSIFTDDFTASFAGELDGIGPNAETVYTSPAWAVTGQQTGGAAPPADQMYVNWRASTGGRSGRGRTFLGPLGLGAVEGNGTPTEAMRTTVQNAADDLVADSQGLTNGAVVVWSRVDNLARDIVSAAVPNKFAVLRSRRD